MDTSEIFVPELSRTLAPQQIMTQYKGQDRRLIFYNVPYTEKETAQIQLFRAYVNQRLVDADYDDQTLLRYLYSDHFNYKGAFDRLNVFHQWNLDPNIQNPTKNSYTILRQGAIYTYGRDKKNRPIIIFNLTRLDFDKYSITDYYCAINTLLTFVIEKTFVKGVVEKYLFIIDSGQKNLTSIPISNLRAIIQKLGSVYSLRLGHMLILNLNYFLKLAFKTVSSFIHEETKNRTTLLSKDQMSQVLELIDIEQLQAKYGGIRSNLQVHWPPKFPGRKSIIFTDRGQQQSQYFSILSNNDEHFRQTFTESNSCCSMGQSQCVIF